MITIAGGLNPRGCADACRRALATAGCRRLRIGIVTGDDVLEAVREAAESSGSPSFHNLDTGAPIGDVRDGLVTANAYLGAEPIVKALTEGADIVITGRIADPSLAVSACVHHFRWNEQFDRLAGATVAGHLIECGAQVTGGISTDWLGVPDAADIGFPIAEVFEDGSCIVTKPHGTGGRVTPMTVKEQLVYEIGDPDNYLSPDVTVSILSLMIEDLGNNRVRLSGAVGKPRPESYKVSATFRDGFRSAGALTIIGRNAVRKARRCGELVLERVREAGFELRDSIIECLGAGDGAAGVVRPEIGGSATFGEVVLRVSVESDSRESVERFSRELMPFITAGPQGTTGYADGRPRVHPVFRYWPCLIGRDAVAPHVEILSCAERTGPATRVTSSCVTPPARQPLATVHADEALPHGPSTPACLYDIACARSGDKGVNANVGVVARTSDWWHFLHTWLTVGRVAAYFSPLGIEGVERYELPNLWALNFVLRRALRGLRSDAQGKALGQILLEMPLPADAAPKMAWK